MHRDRNRPGARAIYVALLCDGNETFVWGDENILETDSGDGCATLGTDVLNAAACVLPFLEQ